MRIFSICKDLFISCTEHDVNQKAYGEFNSKTVISIKYGQIVDHLHKFNERIDTRDVYIFVVLLFRLCRGL